MIRELSKYEISALHHELLFKDIVAAAEKLPPFPSILWKIMPLVRNVSPTSEIEAVLKTDRFLAERVIGLSQTAYYGRRYPIHSLHDAILALGRQRLSQVIITSCASRYFQGRISGYQLDERELWRHSVSTALMAELIARHLRHKKILAIYTASLLHDIGKTVLDLYAKIYLNSSLSQMTLDIENSIEAELMAFGIDHQEVGRFIARRWRFPYEVAVAIGHHHRPLKARRDQDIAAIVYASNRMVHAIEGTGDMGGAFDPERDIIFRTLGIGHRMVYQLQTHLAGSLEGVKQLLIGEK